MTLLKRELLRDDSSRALTQMRIAENSCSQSSRRKLLFVLYALGPYGLLHLVAVQAAESVESRGLVALGKSWIVEYGVDEVFDRAAEDHDGLADVHQFAGAFADDVDAENFAGVAVKDELEAARGVAANLAAGGFAIERHADFIRHVFIGELFLGFADEADFGNGVDAVGIEAGIGGGVHCR